MGKLRRLFWRCVNVVRPDRGERELTREIASHLALLEDQYGRQGLSPQQARRAARLALGGLDQTKEAHRDTRSVRAFSELRQDVRYAVRVLGRTPGFSAVAILTLALGIGASTAMFSVIEAVQLHALPYRDPDRLLWVTVSERNNLAMMFGADLLRWRAAARSFDAMSVLLTGDATIGGDEPFDVRVACLSESVTRLFGVAPAIGRDFVLQEFDHAPQAPGLRASLDNRSDSGVAILSDRLFRRLGSSAELLGRPVIIGSVQYTVVGILPPSFRLPVSPTLQLGIGANRDVDIVLNTTLGPTSRGPGAVLARMKPGVSLGAAVAELEGLRETGRQDGGGAETPPDTKLQVGSLHDQVLKGTRSALLVLSASVGFIWLVACVNIASLVLARSAARQRETAVRIAMGASRLRLVRQMLTENMMLALAGGLVGIVVACVLVRLVAQTTGVDVPRLGDAAVGSKALLFGLLVSTLTGIAVTVIPLLRSVETSGSELHARTGIVVSSNHVRRWHNALVVCELSLALVPLTGSGLMLRSLWHVRSQGAVLAPREVMSARIQSSVQSASAPADRLRESDHLLEQIESLPGVSAAALWSVTFGYPARLSGTPPPKDDIVAMWFNVSRDYREAAGLRLLAGRWFDDRDRAAAPPVIVVSERFARRFAPDVPNADSMVGRTTFGPFPPSGSRDRDGPMTIIGVVTDFRSGRLGILQPDDNAALPQVFFLDTLRPGPPGDLLVRTASSNPLSFAQAIRSIVQGTPGARLMAVRTLDDQLSAAIATRTFTTRLILAFAVIALLLAAVGVFGVMWYSVSQRRREIGLRLALGARQGEVLRLILSHAAMLVMTGAAIGLGGSWLLSTAIAGMLYGVAPSDPVAHVAVLALLIAVAILAAYLPARKAMRLDPMIALRHE